MIKFITYDKYDENKTTPITSFSGKWSFLSNFSTSPVMYDKELYPTVEHAFQAAKTLNLDERQKIQKAKTPGAAKRLGRAVKMRDDWNKIKIGVMDELLRQKFDRNKEDYFKLVHTRNRELIEGNTWGDTFWGQVNGKGSNNLGLLIMRIRNEAFWQAI